MFDTDHSQQPLASARSNRPPVMEIRDLNLWYGEKQALIDVDFDLYENEILAFIGPSGCGKTTFLRVLADLEAPTDGSVSVFGTAPGDARRNRQYGYVFQQPGLYPWRTVQRNVELPLEIMGLPDRRRRASEALAMVELTGFERKYPWQLSGGMQQRASIARALAFDAPLLLMDEPFGALDEIVRDRLNEELLALWSRTHKTVCFVTHSIPEAAFLSTHIVVMAPRPGRVLELIESPLPAERPLTIRETPEFLALSSRVRGALRRGMDE